MDKFIGDALLALFGAPAAHEDDPERAVHSALDMIRRTERLGERAKAYAGSPLLLHIGINTGHVVAGGLGVVGLSAGLVSGVLAYLLEPVVTFLCRQLRMSRTRAVVVIFAMMAFLPIPA